MASGIIMVKNHSDSERGTRKKGNVLFNDALNTFYSRVYGVGHNRDCWCLGLISGGILVCCFVDFTNKLFVFLCLKK